MRLILELADRANPFVENAEPWNLRKDDSKAQQLQDVCTVAINLFRQIVIYISPVLPGLASKTSELLGDEPYAWADAQKPITGTVVHPFKHMLKRADPKDIEKMTDETKAELKRQTRMDPSPKVGGILRFRTPTSI